MIMGAAKVRRVKDDKVGDLGSHRKLLIHLIRKSC